MAAGAASARAAPAAPSSCAGAAVAAPSGCLCLSHRQKNIGNNQLYRKLGCVAVQARMGKCCLRIISLFKNIDKPSIDVCVDGAKILPSQDFQVVAGRCSAAEGGRKLAAGKDQETPHKGPDGCVSICRTNIGGHARCHF